MNMNYILEVVRSFFLHQPFSNRFPSEILADGPGAVVGVAGWGRALPWHRHSQVPWAFLMVKGCEPPKF